MLIEFCSWRCFHGIACRLSAKICWYEGGWLRGGVLICAQARHRVTGEIITLKKLRMDRDQDGVPSHIIREVALLKELDHPNIVRYDRYFGPDIAAALKPV